MWSLYLGHIYSNHQAVIQQHMMARQMIFREVDAPLENVGIHGTGLAFKFARDDLHPVASAKSVVKTHRLQRS